MCNQILNKNIYMPKIIYLQNLFLNSLVVTILIPLAPSKLLNRQKILVEGEQHKLSFTKPQSTTY